MNYRELQTEITKELLAEILTNTYIHDTMLGFAKPKYYPSFKEQSLEFREKIRHFRFNLMLDKGELEHTICSEIRDVLIDMIYIAEKVLAPDNLKLRRLELTTWWLSQKKE